MKSSILILLLFLSFSVIGQNQTENFISFNTGNGMLSHNTVEALTRDLKGYVWVGTNYGLYRLDGYQTQSFNFDPNDSSSLSANNIKALCTDSDGDVWIGTIGGGLNKFDRATSSFIRYLPNDSQNSVSSLNISALTKDHHGDIWIGTMGKGVNKFDKETGEFKAFSLVEYDPENRINSNVSSLFCDKNGNIWIGKNQGEVFMIDHHTYEVKYYGIGTDNKEAIADIGAILGIAQLKNNTLLFTTWNGKVFELDPEKDTFLKLYHRSAFFEENTLSGIAIDQEDNIWISTWNNGLYKTRYQSNEIKHIVRDVKNINSLASNSINKIYIDNNYNLWICLLDKGLGLLSLNHKMIQQLELPKDQVEYINAFSIIKDKNDNIWIGTRGQGIWSYNPTNQKVKGYVAGTTPGLNTNSILCMKMSTDGRIIVGTDGSYISVYDPKTDRFQQIPNKRGDWSNAVFAIADDQHFIYAGTWGGGIKKIDKKTFKYITIDFDKRDQFRNTIFDIEVVDSILWAANIGIGLIKYNINSGEYITYSHSEQYPNFPTERITDIYVENQNSLYLSTDGAGLMHFVPSNAEISSVLDNYNVDIRNIQASITDKNGNLWVTSNSGIVHINKSSNTAYTFNTNNGLSNEQLNKGALFYDTVLSRIYTGSVDGVNYFSPENIIIDSTVNRVVITRLDVMGNNIKFPNNRNIYKAIDVADTIHLFHNEKTVTIHFSAMDLLPSLKSKYFYQLAGFNEEWTELPYNKNFVQYTNLYPGEYTLKLKTCNSEGIIGEQETSITILVHPAFWQTLLFKILIVFVVIAVISLSIFQKYKSLIQAKQELEKKITDRTREITIQKEQIEKQNKELELANNTKDKFFSIISHDLRNPLTSIHQLAELITMQYNTGREERIHQYIDLLNKSSTNALSLLDDLLVWARTQTNRITINLQNVSLDELISESLNYCYPLAEKKNICINYTQNTNYLVFIDRNTVLTVLRNLLTNAIKFSHLNGLIDLSVNRNDKHVILLIKDYGIGMSQNELDNLFKIEKLTSKEGTAGETGTGLGLILCKEFLKLNNGKIWVESTLKKGTTFYIALNSSDGINS